ncbi:MAG: TetR/AcrR family transcriptional regulator [Firmicutes bacterium]|nr:TetR/AcrR family transcriptional regulator [Bacillota bacterium]
MQDDSKRAILETAKYLFAKKGYEGTSVNDIAKRAGAAKSLIYYYFNNKEDILTEILEEGTRDIYETHQKMAERGEALPEDFMMEMMETIASKIRNRNEVIRIMIQEFLKGTHKENKIYEYANTFLDYVKKRSEKYCDGDQEAKMKFIIELTFMGGLPFHLYLISEDFIAESYGFEKEKMWQVFKEVYREDYIKQFYKKINT